MLRVCTALLATALIAPVALAIELAELIATPPRGQLTDTAQIIAAPQSLEAQLQSITAEMGVEIAVVTIDALPTDQTIDSFANQLFAAWGIGRKRDDAGLLLLIAVAERQFRWESGYGVEGALPDVTLKRISERLLVPALQAGNPDAGIAAALQEISARLTGEFIADELPPSSSANASLWLLIVMLLWNGGLALLSGFPPRVEWLTAAGGGALSVLWLGGIALVPMYFYLLFFMLSVRHGKHTAIANDNFIFTGNGRSGRSFGGFSGGRSGGGGFAGRW